jgi:outer membrane protein assembly factor BamB
MPSAVYDKGRLIFASGDWHAYALRADTGQQLWSTDLGGVSTTASAVMAGNAVVVGVRVKHHTEYAAIALDPASGRILWRSPYGHSDASPAYAGGKVFLASSTSPIGSLRPKMTVAAVDAVTGRAIWVHREAPTGLWSAVGSQASAIAGTYAHGTYYQPAPLTDQIIAFDASSGKVRWRFHTAGPVKMSPVVSNGRLYAGDTVGLLYTLDARNGKLLELRAFRAGFTTSPPIIAGNKLIVADGTTVDMLPLSGVHADPRYYDDDTALRGRK